MTSLVAGIDLSTHRLDAALIPLDDDIDLPTHTVLRSRRRGDYPRWSDTTWYRPAVRDLLADEAWGEVVACAYERPPATLGKMSPSTFGLLWAAYGAVGASIPAHLVQTAHPCTPYEWRSVLAPRRPGRAGRTVAREHLNKPGGHALVRQQLADGGVDIATRTHLDEHELDALGLALAWRILTHKASTRPTEAIA